MEVVVPISSTDFNMDSTRFGDFRYFSAPSSPTRVAAIYRDFNSHILDDDEQDFTPKSAPNEPAVDDDDDDKSITQDADFAFDFSGQLDRSYLAAAEELFEEGKIRPLTLPPRLQAEELPSYTRSARSPKSPRSPKRMFREAFSPKSKTQNEFDPFEAAIEKARIGSVRERDRGRERKPRSDNSDNHSLVRRSSRSLSPFRISDMIWSDQDPDQSANPKPGPSATVLHSSSKKWSLKDFLLFRSASEGRAVTTGKDLLRKYSPAAKIKAEDIRSGSFRAVHGSSGSTSGKRSGRKNQVMSAHEQHYKANRTVSEEMRKKTFLPYKQGLFGWFRN